MDDVIEKFEADNPGIKIKTKLLKYGECKEEYMKALGFYLNNERGVEYYE